MKMLAAVMHAQGLPAPYVRSQPFHIEEVFLASPEAGEILVEVHAAGLCHSDLSVVAGERIRPLPIVGGHEGAGIVRDLGAGVVGFEPGDHVVVTNVTGCGRCRACLKQRPVLCKAIAQSRAQGVLATGGRRLGRANGDVLHHYSGVSVFAQYTVVVPGSLVKIPKDVPLDVAAMFGCGVVTGAGAVFNTAKVPPGASVAIFGLGGVGLSAVMAAREAGADRIIVFDVLPSKFPLALAVGATACVDATDPLAVEQVLSWTGGGVDYAFEVSGHMRAFEMAQEVTAPGGEVICVGVGRSDARFSFNHWPFVVEERVLRGSFMGSCRPSVDIPRYVELYRAGNLPVDRLRSETIGFDRLNESLDLLSQGAVVRQILRPQVG